MNRQKHFRFIGYLLFSVLIFGCRLDPPLYPASVSVNADSYQPIIPRAKWVYEEEFQSTVATRTVEASTKSIPLNGRSYYAFNSVRDDEPPQTEYFAKSQEMYLYRALQPGLPDYVDFYYLKENAEDNETWTYPVNETGLMSGRPAQTVTQQIARLPTYDVYGITYTDVVKTRVSLEQQGTEGWEVVATYEFFVSRRVGIIQLVTNYLGYVKLSRLKSYEP
ncbi:MAG: hypothetical protein INR69_13925 [Mucilaginibacter polytrichastri]|nr:hypothetical protein [Mucilaginibacter polytrichastri]